MIRKAKKGRRHVHHKDHFILVISYTLGPSHYILITEWVGMVILGALWLVPIAFLSKEILHGAEGGPEVPAGKLLDTVVCEVYESASLQPFTHL
jgi:hypothetical protein